MANEMRVRPLDQQQRIPNLIARQPRLSRDCPITEPASTQLENPRLTSIALPPASLNGWTRRRRRASLPPRRPPARQLTARRANVITRPEPNERPAADHAPDDR